MVSKLRGGKTAPRLLQDLLLYDPRKPPPSGFNILTDIPVHDEEQGSQLPPPPLVGKGSCSHEWSLKPNQCSAPEDGDKSDPRRAYLLAAYCAVCRSHLDLMLEVRKGGCPAEGWAFHHFLHRPELSEGWKAEATFPNNNVFEWTDSQTFQCSSPACKSRLDIRFKPPRLLQEWVDLLNDKTIIKTRAEGVIAADPTRFEGFAIPPRVDVLLHSKHYLTNPLYNPEKSKKIQGHNKRFLLSMGESCADILNYFGFRREGEDWVPPEVAPAATRPFTDQRNICIDDVEKELFVLISKASDEGKQKAKSEWLPEPALPALEKIFGCTDYQKDAQWGSIGLTRNFLHPFYAGLGATQDFHDDLLGIAYEKQIATDVDNTAYYLECLQEIQEGRNSETLTSKIEVERTKDRISLRDVRNAYKCLGLDIAMDYEDDTIIGTFHSRVADAKKQENEMRLALNVIGLHRSSQKIQMTASQVPQTINNYEEALLYLGAEHSTTDDYVEVLHTLKITETATDKNTLQRAMEIIARHRNSQVLSMLIETDSEMDMETAFAQLGISDLTVDDETLIATYESCIEEPSSFKGAFRKALLALAKHRHSQRIQAYLNPDMKPSEHPPSEWPVGLENIGNTCYLNSLLQFYFTIKPLRDLVLNIDDFKMYTDEQHLRSKRVGSRNVSKREVDRAQQFVDELRKLFQNMIKSYKSYVKPEPELARLTLISSEKAEFIRRNSVLSPTRPSLGDINGEPVLGPLGPPWSTDPIKDTEIHSAADSQTEKEKTIIRSRNQDADNSSDSTLVDASIAADTTDTMMVDEQIRSIQEKVLEDKENLPPYKEARDDSSIEKDLVPLGNASPSRINEKNSLADSTPEHDSSNVTMTGSDANVLESAKERLGEEGTSAHAAPPKRSPPLPPRPKQINTNSSNALEEAQIGAQQDVTEVIANCLFQLQCAIKAESVDDAGEQIDRVKDLFFGKQKSYTTDKQGKTRTKEEYMCDIKVDVASAPRDIYAALDGAYDVQDVEIGGGLEPQYTSISQLPPILQIHVQRSLYNREEKTAFKSLNHLELKEIIYMDRYMDIDDGNLLERRQQSWNWKKQLTRLENRRLQLTESSSGKNTVELLEATSGFLRQISSVNDGNSIDVPPSLMQGIEAATTEAKEEIESLEVQIRNLKTNIASQFNDLHEWPYRLQSVFFHVGSINSGHYWIYIYDFSKEMWRKYNDWHVTKVQDAKEIFKQESGERPPTPYFLVYVQDKKKDNLSNPIFREPEQPPQDNQGDTMMEDYSQVVELPATELRSSNAAEDAQEYGVTESYHRPAWDSGNGGWDHSTTEAPNYGW